MAEKRTGSRFPKTVSSVLAETFRGKPLAKRLEEAELWRIWDRIVGPQIASKARPTKFYDGVLTVTVVSAPWMQQLNFMKREIADGLNRDLEKPLVREIFLKAGRPEKTEQPAAAEKARRRPLTGEEKERITATVEAIQDPELRKAFAELLETHYSTQRSGQKR